MYWDNIEIQFLLFRLNCFVQHYNESAHYVLCCVFTDQPETKKVATNDGKMLDLFVVQDWLNCLA